jgi:hypothetical protein
MLPIVMNRGLRTYNTVFPLTENPISEGGIWIGGATTGLEWYNMRTSTNFAYGTMPGNGTGNAQYADSSSCLAGSWGTTQQATATIKVVSASSTSGVYEEVELRLMTTITADSITGCEINSSIATGQNSYIEVVRWNGALGSFTILGEWDGIGSSVNGDVLHATLSISSGTATISAYRNGSLIGTATDSSPFTSGSPGIGHFLQGATGLDANYGFSAFSCVAW